jgi:polysaccharide deacetylase 2 family uncharacterized protein YibQ
VVAGSAVVAAEPVAPTTLVAGPPLGTPIAPADPALLEPSRDFADGFLPRIGADGRTPAQAYAAAADPSERRPMVAILLAGIGMSATDSDQAIMGAPTAVSLAVSPYTVQPDPLLAEARQHGHEFFLSIPMEPRGYPLDDPGNRALLTGNTTAANAQQLEWAMTRFTGYVGATGALGELHGERFADSSGQLEPVLEELSRRGVLYIDPRPGATLPPGIAGRAVDVLIDEIPGASDIDAHLGRLEQIALTRGSALGLVSVPRPVALERLEAWASGLRHRGVALVPVSAITRVLPRAEKAGP